MSMLKEEIRPAHEAFTRQAPHFDEVYSKNAIIQWMRQCIYSTIDPYLDPGMDILELNSGTGVDATHFAQIGCQVLATDISDGMLKELRQKAKSQQNILVRKLPFEEIGSLEGQYDLIFSNFGGLNCASDPGQIFSHFESLLKPGAMVCLVMLNPYCFWEISLALKGNFKLAFRRFRRKSTACLEGIVFQNYYYSPHEIGVALGEKYHLVKLKGLSVFTPPDYLNQRFSHHQSILNLLQKTDVALSEIWPFNRLGDLFLGLYRYDP